MSNTANTLLADIEAEDFNGRPLEQIQRRVNCIGRSTTDVEVLVKLLEAAQSRDLNTKDLETEIAFLKYEQS